ncbi:Putative acyl-CoA ligase [Mycobacteroides abscessus]|nr:Putative acyl-CoA ligase [Mycobacteroides abscessus]
MYPGTHAAQFPDKPAVVMAGSGATLTYGELDKQSRRLARHWYDSGLRKGDHVALLSDNVPEVFVVYWAALRSGLYITSVNHHLAPAEVSYIVNDSGSSALVVAAGVREQAEAILDDTPAVTLRLAFGGHVHGYDSYEDALDGASDEPLPAQPAGSDMLYSSGTTGRPKGIKVPLADRQAMSRIPSQCCSRISTDSIPRPYTCRRRRFIMLRRCGSAGSFSPWAAPRW